VKQDADKLKSFNALLRTIKSTYKVEEPPARNPVTELVIGFLQWEATQEMAEDAFGRIMAVMVDINELRVTYDHETLGLIGPSYPRAEERIARMREALNEIYIREHAVDLATIHSVGKKDQRAYIQSLPGVPPYVASHLMLVSYGIHAMPVDEKLVGQFVSEGIADAGAAPEEVETMLLRQVKANDALKTYLLLQAWSDELYTNGKAKKTRKTTKKKATGARVKSESRRAKKK